LVIVKVAALLAAYQLLSPAFVTVIEQVPEDFCAVTVSPLVPLSTQSELDEEKVSAPVPEPPLAVSAVGTLYTKFAFVNVGVAPVPLST
jgi:hypothetical protein